MDLDLRHQLLLGTSLSQCGLCDNFRGRDSLVFEVCELETAGETSLTKEFALEVLFDANFAVVFDNFLFYDGLGTVDALFRVTLLHFTVDFSSIL